MDLGKRFKHYRKKAKLTQKEAAEIIGVNDYQLGNYETNRSEPSLTVLKKMSQTYHVSIDKMLANKWMVNDQEAVNNEEDDIVDMDELIKRLTDIVNEMSKLNKK